MDITVTSNANVVQTDLAAIGPRARAAVFAVITRWAPKLLRYIATNKLTSGGILEPRTGTLRRSLFSRVETSGDAITGTVGFDLSKAPYGRVQELGGTITAKAAGHLTIPVGEALTAKGVARFTARQVISDPQAFGFDGTFTAKNMIFGRIGRITGHAEIIPLFALKDSVTLPAREPLASSLADNVDAITSDVASAVAGAIQ